jgi:hypothetical protein
LLLLLLLLLLLRGTGCRLGCSSIAVVVQTQASQLSIYGSTGRLLLLLLLAASTACRNLAGCCPT